MKKRRLKKWVKTTIAIVIIYAIGILVVLAWTKQVEWFNHNIEKCGSNYCDR